MLYIILIIIAIGVLLASEAGKKLLGLLIILLLITAGLYLAFLIVIVAIGLFSDKGIRESILIVLGAMIPIAYAIWGLYAVYKKYQRRELTKEVIKNKARELWLENWNEGTGSKIAIIFIISSILFVATMLIYSFTIKSFWQ